MENSDSEMQEEIPGVRRSSRKKTPNIKFSEYELPECKSNDESASMKGHATKISKIPANVGKATTQKRKTVVSDKKVQCNICASWLKNRESLATHYSTIHNKEPMRQCKLCEGSQFFTVSNFQGHVIRMHSEDKPKSTTPKTCPYCNEEYEPACSDLAMKQHVEKCKAGKEIPRRKQCHICKKYFSAIPTNFQKHLNTHSTPKKVNHCEHCGMTFSIHTNDKTFDDHCKFRCPGKRKN